MKARAVFTAFLMLGTALSQTKPHAERNSLVVRALKGDDSALSEMERSGDAQDLQSLFRDPDYTGRGAAHLLLARMGDREALQYFACRSLDDAPVQDMDQIGGEFIIEVYRHLLDSDSRFLSRIRENGNISDALVNLPSSMVLFLLPKLLPDAGIPSPARLDVQAGKDVELKSRWRAWIDNHQSELRQLKPTAEGISFDQHSCSDIYDPTAMHRRLQTISGQGAIDCNREPDAGDSGAVSNCIKTSFSKKRAFYAQNNLYGIDSGVAVGLAGDGNGDVYTVAYDDSGVSTTGLGKEIELFDNKHTVVVPCPKPIRFRPSISWNGLTCLTQGGNHLLSPKM